MTLHKPKLSKTFDANKKTVQELSDVKTKKLRNMIAGYITKKMKKSEDF
jgi:small subunit ribosomal protein S17e